MKLGWNRVPPFAVRHVEGSGHAIFDGQGMRISQYFDDDRGLRARVAELAAQARKKAGVRPCMCCGAPFPSAGIQNRLCDPCRQLGQGEAPLSFSHSSARRGRLA